MKCAVPTILEVGVRCLWEPHLGVKRIRGYFQTMEASRAFKSLRCNHDGSYGDLRAKKNQTKWSFSPELETAAQAIRDRLLVRTGMVLLYSGQNMGLGPTPIVFYIELLVQILLFSWLKTIFVLGVQTCYNSRQRSTLFALLLAFMF
uniref:Uncharacterized protein n=1 Tax=Lepeophtheirus salmonis TaxID=72036 RepID=A0A0K2TTD2_LEPSM